MTAPYEVVETDALHAEGGGVLPAHIRIVQQDLQVERPQQFDHPAADP